MFIESSIKNMCDENNKNMCNADALSHDADVTVMCGVDGEGQFGGFDAIWSYQLKLSLNRNKTNPHEPV